MEILDASQISVIDVPHHERQVVVAAPGSGKTFTAGKLIGKIDSQLAFPEEYDVIYISFSNAAVNALIEGNESELDGLKLMVDPGTLDSFANALVLENGLDFDHSDNFFEERVKAAIDIVKNGDTSYFEDTVHVIIDEAQDIYGLRKELALELIKFLPRECGVTVIGDPMQSIYSFLGEISEKNGPSHPSDGSLLLDLIRRKDITPKQLTGQYRATSARMKRIHQGLRSIDYSTPKVAQVSQVEHALNEATVISEPNLAYWSRKWGSDTAILTRNNAEVILLCGALADHDVIVSPLFPPEQRSRFPSWFSAWADQVGSRPFAPTSLHDFLMERAPEDLREAQSTGYDFSIPWEESTLRDLADAFTKKRGHSAHSKNQQRPVISTIHQSKGRQFETVVLVNAFELIREDPFYGVETELAYVGITRARKKIQLLDFNFPRTRTFQSPHHRSIIHNYARSAPQAIEVRPSDIDRETFYGESAGQAALEKLAPASKLELSLVHPDSPVPRYRIQVNGVTVGLTNASFGESVARLTRTKQGSWPILGPVMHDGTETVFGNENGQRRPCWLIPRAFGFSNISFS